MTDAPEKPPMPETLRPFIDTARARHMKRPPNPGVVVEGSESAGLSFAANHRDREAWEVQIADSFGTRSGSVCETFLDQLAELCIDYRGNTWRPNEQELNAALNIVSGVRPRNEVQAALAAQMVAVHMMTMKLFARALQNPYGDPRTAAVAGKLARTYSMQCETMAKLQGRTGKQKITVKYERHDHRHEHKHLHTETGGEGSSFGGRAQEPIVCAGDVSLIEHEPLTALRSPDPAGDALPVPGDDGAGAVSPPRRRARVRRAKGGA